jgi:hypothetical protein
MKLLSEEDLRESAGGVRNQGGEKNKAQNMFPGEIMKRVLSYCLIGVVLVSGSFWGCSDRKEPASEKGAIKKMTEETAREAVNQIRTPIDKARSVAQQQEDKAKEIDDALKQQ